MKAIEYAALTKMQLAGMVEKSGFNRAMAIRREMQEELAKTAQKGIIADRMPEFVQCDMIERIAWIEKWCRHYFMYHRMKSLNSSDSNLTHKERKNIARAEWENEIIPRLSY